MIDANFVLKERNAVGDVDVYYVYPDGHEQLVSENQDIYTQWKKEGNIAKVVEWYVEPVPPPAPLPKSLEERQMEVELIREKKYQEECDNQLLVILAYQLEDNVEKAETLKQEWLEKRRIIRMENPTPEI